MLHIITTSPLLLISRFFRSVPFRREMKQERMDVLLTLLGNIIEGLGTDRLSKIAYPAQKRYKFLL